jgi:HEAT repeat protein
MMKDRDEHIQFEAAVGLAEMGFDDSLDFLFENFSKFPVGSLEKASAVRQFGRFGYQKAIPLLITLVDHAVMNLGAAAIDALWDLTGQDFGPDEGQWKQWWMTEGLKRFEHLDASEK